ncbi:MAG: 1,4-dihydroxy-2-naphthoate octaprenyltransferase [Verrucomicrobiales bacterium]|nr:1,4-dihydroxy-2-naphthoate octaprenyltransferase [Verrucomicrobiales bacterium]|tara:strand:+ start:2761 stop:3651 length:891 start_codon:yes stop_codon:yes gene_type:complete
MKAWILAARPKTLPAAVVPVWVGSMPFLIDGTAQTGSWLLFISTLVSCLCIQVATNLFNDAIDFDKGADTNERLGPKRVTASGLLSRKAVVGGALSFCGLAAIIAIPMIAERGWLIVVIGSVSLFFSYGYTGGPLPLAYRGLGELFVILFFGFAAVLGSYFVQTGKWGNTEMWLLAIQCGLYSAVLIAINNLRDRDEDETTGKRTLAVRFGTKFARYEIVLMGTLAAILVIPVGLLSGCSAPLAVTFALLLAGFHLTLSRRVFRTEPSAAYNVFLAWAALQLLLFATLTSIMFALK